MHCVSGEMTLRRFASQLRWLTLLYAATILFLLRETVGEDWEERLGAAAYPAVEYVAEKPSKTYDIPLELNEEPFILVEWSTEASRLSRGFQFILPPGILLVMSIAAAALLVVWNAREDSPFVSKKKAGGREAAAQVHVESEDLYDIHETQYSTTVDSSSVLQSVLKKLSADLTSAITEALEKKNAAVRLLNDPSISDQEEMAKIITSLLEVTDKLAASVKGINHALDALQRPLSDSQATSRLNSALEEMQMGIQKLLPDSRFKREIEGVRTYLTKGEGPTSEPAHQLPDKQSAAPESGAPVVGSSETGEPGRKVPQEVMTKLYEWLEAVHSGQHVLVEAEPVLSKAVSDMRATYDLF